MSSDQQSVDTPVPAGGEALAPEPVRAEEDYAPIARERDWADEPGELPPRPRRRLLAPVPLALLGVLLLACGFIGGVLVEKGQTTTTAGGASASGLASRLAALRGGASGAASGTSTGGGTAGGGAFAGGFGAGRARGAAGTGGATIGEVAYIDGSTLYVSDAEGNTVKVKTSAASSISKTVKASLHGIHPGETVVVRGPKSSGGAVQAESISVGAEAGGGGGGLGALFGGGASGGGGARGSSAGTGGPTLFGN